MTYDVDQWFVDTSYARACVEYLEAQEIPSFRNRPKWNGNHQKNSEIVLQEQNLLHVLRYLDHTIQGLDVSSLEELCHRH